MVEKHCGYHAWSAERYDISGWSNPWQSRTCYRQYRNQRQRRDAGVEQVFDRTLSWRASFGPENVSWRAVDVAPCRVRLALIAADQAHKFPEQADEEKRETAAYVITLPWYHCRRARNASERRDSYIAYKDPALWFQEIASYAVRWRSWIRSQHRWEADECWTTPTVADAQPDRVKSWGGGYKDKDGRGVLKGD